MKKALLTIFATIGVISTVLILVAVGYFLGRKSQTLAPVPTPTVAVENRNDAVVTLVPTVKPAIATNTPTPVPTATGIPTPVPTATSTPTPIPTATNTPTPTPTPSSTPTPLPSEDFITTGETVVDVGSAVCHIGENVYVPADFGNVTNLMMNIAEKVSGLRFDGDGYCAKKSMEKKPHIYITRENLYAGTDWYTGWDTSELGSAYAFSSEAWIAPGDFLLGNSYTLIHELSHVLMWRQSKWYHETTLSEGFAEYTTYLTLLELEEKYPEAAVYFNKSINPVNNMDTSYHELYKQPIEYWFDNYFEYAGNSNYTIGFRFMAYLHDVYGDYSSWILNFREQYPFEDRNQINDVSPVEYRIAVLKQTYGDDVLDNFYPWLKEHESDFEVDYNKVIDRSGLQEMNLYPAYNAFEEKMVLEDILYKDLLIHLEPAKKYIGEYKGRDISKLVLECVQPLVVNLFHEDGSSTQITMGPEREPVSLDGVNSIQLVGEGTLYRLEFNGFHQCDYQCTECGLCTEEGCWDGACLDKCSGHE